MKRLSQYELGYIAGIIDGEGSIGIHKSRSHKKEYLAQYHPVVTVSNKDEKLMKFLVRAIGGLYYRSPKRNINICYRWEITNKKLIRQTLVKLNLLVKKRQAKLLLQFINIMQNREWVGKEIQRHITRRYIYYHRQIKGLNYQSKQIKTNYLRKVDAIG